MAVYPESWAGSAVKAKVKYATNLCGLSAEMKNECENERSNAEFRFIPWLT
jgi:hypothetical protein